MFEGSILLRIGYLKLDYLQDCVDSILIEENGEDMLFELCSSVLCYEDAIQKIIDRGVNVNAESEMLETPLHIFCRTTYYPIKNTTMKVFDDEVWLEYLYYDIIESERENGFYPYEYRNKEYYHNWNIPIGENPLLKRNPEILVKNGAQVFAMDFNGRNALFGCYDKEIIKYLINRGLDINSRDNYGCTPLFLCIEEDIIRYLVELGADFTIKDSYGRYAVEYNESKYLEELMKMNDISIFPNDSGYAPGTLAHIISERKQEQLDEFYEIVKKYGISLYVDDEIDRINETDVFNDGCENKIGRWMTLNMLKELNSEGINLKEKNEEGRDLLDILCEKCETIEALEWYSEIIEWLLSIGFTMKNRNYIYALVNLEIVQFFMKNGYDFNQVDEEDRYHFNQIIESVEDEKIIEYLAEHGVWFESDAEFWDAAMDFKIPRTFLELLVKYKYLSAEEVSMENLMEMRMRREEARRKDLKKYESYEIFEDDAGRTCWVDENGKVHKDYIDEDDMYNDPEYW